MTPREEAENVRLWLFVEDRLAEDEAAHIEALSDEELRRAGVERDGEARLQAMLRRR